MHAKTEPGSAIAKPSWPLLGAEPWRAAAEYLTSKVMSMKQLPAGDGHPVVVFPGLASDGRAVAPLCSFLRRLGYDAIDWGRGWNTGPQGDVDAWLDVLACDVAHRLGVRTPAPTLIGWSLGGIYARELAKRPELAARQVITIGTPFNGQSEHTHAGWVYRLLNGAHAELAPALQQRLRTPPPVPTTSIYSRSDGIVAWQACRHEHDGPLVQDIEVRGSHLGMGWNPRVLRVVAEQLAQPKPARASGMSIAARRRPALGRSTPA